jgi:hypothetical protein
MAADGGFRSGTLLAEASVGWRAALSVAQPGTDEEAECIELGNYGFCRQLFQRARRLWTANRM